MQDLDYYAADKPRKDTTPPVSLLPHPLVNEFDERVRDALSARTAWEAKQVDFFRLRHEGLRRLNKPFPMAADMNWPLSDMMVEKIKPYYVQQVFANELLANFYALRRELSPFNGLAAQWFDFRLRQRTNFENEIISVTDYMLVTGKGLLKVRWDDRTKQVRFDSVDPMMFIVPAHTTTLAEADWCVQVHQVSEATYRRNENWKQDEAFVKRLITNAPAVNSAKESAKFAREGITHTARAESIILWEVYQRTDNCKWETFVMAPLVSDELVRDPMELPFDHSQLPFVEFNCEIKDKGYYASRGIPERIAPLQVSMSRLWNEKLDALAYFGKPLFVSDSPLGNTGNVRLVPGHVLPFGVRRVEMGQPPVQWDGELVGHRITAEQLIGVPDAGLTSQMNNNERRTASEVNLIGSLMSQVVDLRSRVFRRSLAEAFAQAWSLYVQYDKASLDYFYRNELLALPPAALADDYRIEPLASADNFNKQFVHQKKVTRFQMLQNNPFVNQGELVRDLIAADDPQDVKRLFMDSDMQSADQLEDQAGEIGRMLIGFPSQVKPVDNDAAHLTVLRQFVERRVTTGETISAELALLMLNHANMHFRQLMQKSPEQAQQLEAPMQQMAAYLGKVVAEAQAQMQQAQAQMQQASAQPAQPGL